MGESIKVLFSYVPDSEVIDRWGHFKWSENSMIIYVSSEQDVNFMVKTLYHELAHWHFFQAGLLQDGDFPVLSNEAVVELMATHAFKLGHLFVNVREAVVHTQAVKASRNYLVFNEDGLLKIRKVSEG